MTSISSCGNCSPMNLSISGRVLRPIRSFLLSCINSPAHTSVEAELINTPDDEEILLTFAAFHGLLPLLDQQCFTARPGLIQKLNSETSLIRQQNFQMTALLMQLHYALTEQGITVINIKGAVLAQHAYRDISLRPFSDIDILVQQQDLQAVASTLVSLGYQPHDSLLTLSHPFVLSHFSDISFSHQQSGVIIELHWQLLKNSQAALADMPSLFRHTYPVDIQGTLLASLPLEEEFVYLCIHAAKHRFERLEWLHDLALLFQEHSDSYNWEKMLHIAREECYLDAYLLALSLLERDFQTAVNNEQTRTLLRQSHLNWLIQQVEGFQLSAPYKRPKKRIRWKEFLFAFALQKQAGRRMALLGMLLFPLYKEDILMSRPLPKQLCFLYYFYRPLRFFHLLFRQPRH